jgi:hypothetical protein
LGIITKPDFLEASLENETSWLELAQNKDIFFELGWYMLLNCRPNEAHLSFQQRNENERQFFNSGRYRNLPKQTLGIDTLTMQLSELLYSHLKRELPELKNELDNMSSAVNKELHVLGQDRSTMQEQRMFLLKLLLEGESLTKAAVCGVFEDPFFQIGDVEDDGHRNA